MKPEFTGIEMRLERLKSCLLKLEPLRTRGIQEFLQDSYLQDIVERNLEVAAQACIDIAARIISVEQLEKPADSYGAILRLGEAGILPLDFSQRLAPLAGFRNILVHEYVSIDWTEVYSHLQKLSDLQEFAGHVKTWLKTKVSP
jgi:uncharacterized protein YutE (UPF0331/DUF86 family)